MSWKKNGLSMILWAAFLLGSSAALIYYFYDTFLIWGYTESICIMSGIGVWLILLLLFCLIRVTGKILNGRIKPVPSVVMAVLEGILFVGILAAGIGIRIYNIQYAGEEAAYFDMAQVAEGGSIPQMVHGGTYVYLHLLRGLFLLVGNKWMAGIWLQIALQAIAAILLYLAVCQIGTGAAGLTFLAAIMLLPSEMLRGLTYSPDMMYLCAYAIGLVCVASFLSRYAEGEMESPYDVIILVFSGAWIAFVCYLDVSGLTLPVMAVSALWMNRFKSRKKCANVWLGLGVLIGAAVLFFAGYLALYGYSCGKSIIDVWNDLIRFYAVKGHDPLFWMKEDGWNASVLLYCGMVFASFAYPAHRKTEKLSPWIGAGLLLCVLEYLHIPSAQLNSFAFMTYVASVLGGIGISESFSFEMAEEEQIPSETESLQEEGIIHKKESLPKEEVQMEERMQIEETMQMEEKVPGDMEFMDLGEPPKIKLIQNPLPMPKKHVRKTMEYGFHPEEDMMHYDIEVDENDDYDIS